MYHAYVLVYIIIMQNGSQTSLSYSLALLGVLICVFIIQKQLGYLKILLFWYLYGRKSRFRYDFILDLPPSK